MKTRHTALAAALLAFASPALASGPTTTGALATPANRIVGAWSNVANVGPCGGSVGEAQRQTIVFHAGGTFLDNPRFPPQGLPNGAQRSIGVGTWSFDPETGLHHLVQQFDWYLDNAYNGYQVVERVIVMSADGNTASGPVHTVRYSANGAPLAELCGQAVSTRL